jgi:hypothetical protein
VPAAGVAVGRLRVGANLIAHGGGEKPAFLAASTAANPAD